MTDAHLKCSFFNVDSLAVSGMLISLPCNLITHYIHNCLEEKYL
jgi:hypothetical protein